MAVCGPHIPQPQRHGMPPVLQAVNIPKASHAGYGSVVVQVSPHPLTQSTVIASVGKPIKIVRR